MSCEQTIPAFAVLGLTEKDGMLSLDMLNLFVSIPECLMLAERGVANNDYDFALVVPPYLAFDYDLGQKKLTCACAHAWWARYGKDGEWHGFRNGETWPISRRSRFNYFSGVAPGIPSNILLMKTYVRENAHFLKFLVSAPASEDDPRLLISTDSSRINIIFNTSHGERLDELLSGARLYEWEDRSEAEEDEYTILYLGAVRSWQMVVPGWNLQDDITPEGQLEDLDQKFTGDAAPLEEIGLMRRQYGQAVVLHQDPAQAASTLPHLAMHVYIDELLKAHGGLQYLIHVPRVRKLGVHQQKVVLLMENVDLVSLPRVQLSTQDALYAIYSCARMLNCLQAEGIVQQWSPVDSFALGPLIPPKGSSSPPVLPRYEIYMIKFGMLCAWDYEAGFTADPGANLVLDSLALCPSDPWGCGADAQESVFHQLLKGPVETTGLGKLMPNHQDYENIMYRALLAYLQHEGMVQPPPPDWSSQKAIADELHQPKHLLEEMKLLYYLLIYHHVISRHRDLSSMFMEFRVYYQGGRTYIAPVPELETRRVPEDIKDEAELFCKQALEALWRYGISMSVAVFPDTWRFVAADLSGKPTFKIIWMPDLLCLNEPRYSPFLPVMKIK